MYFLARLIEEANEEPLDAVLDRIGGRSGGSLPVDEAVSMLREERDPVDRHRRLGARPRR